MANDVANMVANLGGVQRSVPRALETAIYRFGNVEMTEMKRRTPVEEGTLKSSGQVDQPVWKGNVLTLILGFGGAAESYAFWVHEDLEAFHKVGQAKYIESVLDESAPYFEQRIGRDFARAMGFNAIRA